MMNLNAVKFSFVAFCGGLLLVACGDDVTKVTEVKNPGLEVVASADSLGKCTEERSGEMKFAAKDNAVYVCTDSSWKNVSAVENVACSVESLKDSSGYKIVCGSDSVGVIFNGKDGKKGETGKAGTSCTVTESPLLDSDFSGGYLVVCGGDTVGMLVNGRDGEGCTITDNGDGSVMQVCGSDTVNLYKAFCGGNVYDPEKAFCYEDSLYFCGEKAYDPSKEICDARDIAVYRYVKIGTQMWMAENLNYAYMPDTLSFCYDNDSVNCEKYGRLYTWSAAMDSASRFSENGKDCGYGRTCSPTYPVRGACPEGWHLPSHDEWGIFESYVASNSNDSTSYALKSTSGWDNYYGSSGNGSDDFGFGIYPAGRYTANGFSNIRQYAYFWSPTEADNYSVYSRNLSNEFIGQMGYGLPKGWAVSIRCVKD